MKMSGFMRATVPPQPRARRPRPADCVARVTAFHTIQCTGQADSGCASASPWRLCDKFGFSSPPLPPPFEMEIRKPEREPTIHLRKKTSIQPQRHDPPWRSRDPPAQDSSAVCLHGPWAPGAISGAFLFTTATTRFGQRWRKTSRSLLKVPMVTHCVLLAASYPIVKRWATKSASRRTHTRRHHERKPAKTTVTAPKRAKSRQTGARAGANAPNSQASCTPAAISSAALTSAAT